MAAVVQHLEDDRPSSIEDVLRFIGFRSRELGITGDLYDLLPVKNRTRLLRAIGRVIDGVPGKPATKRYESKLYSLCETLDVRMELPDAITMSADAWKQRHAWRQQHDRAERSREAHESLVRQVRAVVRQLNVIMDQIIEARAVDLDREMLDHLERARGSALRAIATPEQREHEEKMCLGALRGTNLEHVMRQLVVELAFQEEHMTTNQPGSALVPDLWTVGE